MQELSTVQMAHHIVTIIYRFRMAGRYHRFDFIEHSDATMYYITIRHLTMFVYPIDFQKCANETV